MAINKFTILLAGAKDTSFDTGIPVGFDSGITTFAFQPDGKVLAGGEFTSYNGETSNYIARLNSNGSLDTSFNIGTGFDGAVNTLALQSDGKILVGGWFTSYNGETSNYIVRLNSNGSRDTGFSIGTGFNNAVNTLALQSDGKILVGGWFIIYQDKPAGYLIKILN